MTATNRTPGTVPLRAALAILKTMPTPIMHCAGGYITAGDLAEIIERETNVTCLLEALENALPHLRTLGLREATAPHVHGDRAHTAYEKALAAIANTKAA